MSWRNKEFKRRHKLRKPQEIDAIIERAFSNLHDDPDLIAEIEWKRDDPEDYAEFQRMLEAEFGDEDDYTAEELAAEIQELRENDV